jgi:hypothetical protein
MEYLCLILKQSSSLLPGASRATLRHVAHLAEGSVPPFSSKDVRLSGTTLERAKKIVAVLNEASRTTLCRSPRPAP